MNEEIKVIDVKQSVFANNESRADDLRKELKKQGTYMINLMSSPGSGKTTMLIALINSLKDKLKIGVMEADIDAIVDAETIGKETGVPCIQLHTCGACHLDAKMAQDGIKGMGDENYDLLILENIGNLVCPAEFDTGAELNMALLSVPEGDDKPLKYPLIFTVGELFVFTKMDTLPVFDFDRKLAEERIKVLNPNAVFFGISAKTGEGIEELADYIYEQVKAFKSTK